MSERTCETCRHVFGGAKDDRSGQYLTAQKCGLYRAGKSRMTTWVVTHDERKCGPERRLWEAKQ
jgi:hypothetical protein